MKLAWVGAVALAAFCHDAGAQAAAAPSSIVPPSAPAALPLEQPAGAIPAPPGAGIRLAADTPVRIELAEAASSRDRKRGDKFAIRLAAPIVVDGRTLAPAGATGMGEVVYGERGRGGGTPGKLVLAARYIDVGPVRVRLKAFNLAAGGDSKFRELQVEAQLISVGVLLINGHDVLYPVGTRARAKVAEDVLLPPLPSGDPAAPTAEATPPPPTSPASSGAMPGSPPNPPAGPPTAAVQELPK
jgi:hypothetical protein